MNPVRSAVAIVKTGLVTSVGLSAPAACAAIRAGLTNPSETRFMDSEGEWIMGHVVPLERPWRGRSRLAKMAAMAVAECLEGIGREQWPSVPLLLCVAEPERPGRLEGLDEELLLDVQQELAGEFAPSSRVLAHGRTSVPVALLNARMLLQDPHVPCVAVAATDSLLRWPTLAVYEEESRLLASGVSNGFIPGEGAGCVLLRRPGGARQLLCAGLGFAVERAHIAGEEPLRGDGLTQAIRGALSEAGCEMHHIDFRISDLSGEQYYFKEASLALARLLRERKEECDIWHPADCIGETGAAIGAAVLAVAHAACHKGYAPGANMLVHTATDDGKRAAAVLRFSGD